jgi:predicted dithiol-disulfide oxidoreductase (DUF899 family)
MMTHHAIRFPGESPEYRKLRDELLTAEINLRKQIEETAAMRRQLPLGGKLKEDYTFQEMKADGGVKDVSFSELFRNGKNTLVLYGFMFDPSWETPCSSCTSILDGLNGTAPHILDRVNLAVVAKAPIQKIKEWASGRGWSRLRLLSSGKNSYNSDYHTQNEKGEQIPVLNVFQRADNGIFHFYSTELLFAPSEKGQDSRHVDSIWPLWNVFDMTPEGRGEKWNPRYSYE